MKVRQKDHASPHKVCMLLAVIDLIENGRIESNDIFFNAELKQKYGHYFDVMRTHGDQQNPFLPYFHLRSEGFWSHVIKRGRQEFYDHLITVSGTPDISDNIEYAALDDNLFALLNQSDSRESLRSALFENIDPKNRQNFQSAMSAWSQLECDLAVADYLDMLERELKGESYNKSEHNRILAGKLAARRKGAIEYKHQNISAILIEIGYPYISGYKPAFNYQQLLKQTVKAHLERAEVAQVADNFIIAETTKADEIEWEKVLSESPVVDLDGDNHVARDFSPRKYDYGRRESNNRKLGELGEEFVLDYEKYRLTKAGREDLVNDVEWTSKEKGDGAGYDIRSFEGERDEELFIEVKTTKQGKYLPFYISRNEVEFSKLYAEKYSVYRVFNYQVSPRLFILEGDISQCVNLSARTYKASF